MTADGASSGTLWHLLEVGNGNVRHRTCLHRLSEGTGTFRVLVHYLKSFLMVIDGARQVVAFLFEPSIQLEIQHSGIVMLKRALTGCIV